MRTTKSLIALPTRGRPTGVCGLEVSACWSTNLRFQAKMVSGWVMVAIFFQRLPAQLGAKRSEFLALAVGQRHATVDLIAQDAIFCHEISIAKPEAVVH